MSHTPDEIAELVSNALTAHGSLTSHAFLSSGEGAPEGTPFVLIKPEGTGQMWCLRIEGPMDPITPEGIAAASVALGFATENPE
ncbi:hypothetical protein ACFWA9_10155 [Kitasatospora sp. NPDC059973]|uniref:hypothetical protein n=1 Tax=Kitasatospora sp. NPDC059973 TaxID=3347020 RepID=UPI00368B5A03